MSSAAFLVAWHMCTYINKIVVCNSSRWQIKYDWLIDLFILEKDRPSEQLVGISVRWIVSATSVIGKVDSRPSDLMMSYNCAMVGCWACVCCWFQLIWCLECWHLRNNSCRSMSHNHLGPEAPQRGKNLGPRAHADCAHWLRWPCIEREACQKQIAWPLLRR